MKMDAFPDTLLWLHLLSSMSDYLCRVLMLAFQEGPAQLHTLIKLWPTRLNFSTDPLVILNQELHWGDISSLDNKKQISSQKGTWTSLLWWLQWYIFIPWLFLCLYLLNDAFHPGQQVSHYGEEAEFFRSILQLLPPACASSQQTIPGFDNLFFSCLNSSGLISCILGIQSSCGLLELFHLQGKRYEKSLTFWDKYVQARDENMKLIMTTTCSCNVFSLPVCQGSWWPFQMQHAFGGRSLLCWSLLPDPQEARSSSPQSERPAPSHHKNTWPNSQNILDNFPV